MASIITELDAMHAALGERVRLLGIQSRAWTEAAEALRKHGEVARSDACFDMAAATDLEIELLCNQQEAVDIKLDAERARLAAAMRAVAA
jgi:hypothetical protein